MKKTKKEMDDFIAKLLEPDRGAMERAAHLSSLNQRIQVRIWNYMEKPKLKRKAMDVAEAIIDDCFETLKKVEMRKKLDEVQLVCQKCGKKYAKSQYSVSTWYEGICDICGKKKSVTEARDFNHFR